VPAALRVRRTRQRARARVRSGRWAHAGAAAGSDFAQMRAPAGWSASPSPSGPRLRAHDFLTAPAASPGAPSWAARAARGGEASSSTTASPRRATAAAAPLPGSPYCPPPPSLAQPPWRDAGAATSGVQGSGAAAPPALGSPQRMGGSSLRAGSPVPGRAWSPPPPPLSSSSAAAAQQRARSASPGARPRAASSPAGLHTAARAAARAAADAADACERAFSPLRLLQSRRSPSPSRSLFGDLGGPASPEAWLHADASALATVQARATRLSFAFLKKAFSCLRVAPPRSLCVCI
jgi:hypothetical protein